MRLPLVPGWRASFWTHLGPSAVFPLVCFPGVRGSHIGSGQSSVLPLSTWEVGSVLGASSVKWRERCLFRGLRVRLTELASAQQLSVCLVRCSHV